MMQPLKPGYMLLYSVNTRTRTATRSRDSQRSVYDTQAGPATTWTQRGRGMATFVRPRRGPSTCPMPSLGTVLAVWNFPGPCTRLRSAGAHSCGVDQGYGATILRPSAGAGRVLQAERAGSCASSRSGASLCGSRRLVAHRQQPRSHALASDLQGRSGGHARGVGAGVHVRPRASSLSEEVAAAVRTANKRGHSGPRVHRLLLGTAHLYDWSRTMLVHRRLRLAACLVWVTTTSHSLRVQHGGGV
jgi:hypothetical protein